MGGAAVKFTMMALVAVLTDRSTPIPTFPLPGGRSENQVNIYLYTSARP